MATLAMTPRLHDNCFVGTVTKSFTRYYCSCRNKVGAHGSVELRCLYFLTVTAFEAMSLSDSSLEWAEHIKPKMKRQHLFSILIYHYSMVEGRQWGVHPRFELGTALRTAARHATTSGALAHPNPHFLTLFWSVTFVSATFLRIFSTDSEPAL